MKITCEGPNGEKFEAVWEMKTGNLVSEWQAGAKEMSEFSRDAAQKALDVWAGVCLKALELGSVELGEQPESRTK